MKDRVAVKSDIFTVFVSGMVMTILILTMYHLFWVESLRGATERTNSTLDGFSAGCIEYETTEEYTVFDPKSCEVQYNFKERCDRKGILIKYGEVIGDGWCFKNDSSLYECKYSRRANLWENTTTILCSEGCNGAKPMIESYNVTRCVKEGLVREVGR